MTVDAGLGGKIGTRVAKLVADGSIYAKARASGIQHDAALKIQDSFFRLVGHEIHGTLGPVFAQVAESEDAPQWVRDTFGFLAYQTGQWQAFLATSAGGAAVSAGLVPLFNNELAPVTQNLIAQNPNFVIDVGSAASIAARGLVGHSTMETEARRQGISGRRFQWLVRSTQRPMAPGDVLQSVNRGGISVAEAMDQLREAGLTQEAATHTLALRRAELSPQELAELVNFGVLTENDAEPIAARSGMRQADFHRLVLGGGQPPGLELLLRAYRMGVIDRDRLRRGLQQSPVRIEWFDVVEALRFVPPPTEAALSAATQNLLSPAKAKRIWTENGFDPSGFEWALESNGRPLGVEQAAELANRGIIDWPDAEQMFLESAIKNKYVPLIRHLFERLPTMEMTGRMVREGVWTKAQGVTNLRGLGFNAANAAALVDLASAERSAEARALSVSMIQELYEAQAMTEAEAADALAAFGYEDDDIALLLAVRMLRRERRSRDLAASKVRARFIAHKISEAEAYNALDALGVPPAQRDDLVDTWSIERDVNVPLLTTSQVQQALRKGLIDRAGAFGRLTEAGYSADDAEILVRLVEPAG